MRARFAYGLVAATLFFATELLAADFGSRHGVAPANIDGITEILRQDPYDLELLISFGTSKGGSAGHLALAVRDGVPGDDLVYSANFYADRSDEHASGFYTADLMLGIPKKEYLFKTSSSLAETAAFGLDFGEIYKRSVIGVRVYGVPADEKTAVTDFFQRVNADYHRQAEDTEYHDGEVKYDYMQQPMPAATAQSMSGGQPVFQQQISQPQPAVAPSPWGLPAQPVTQPGFNPQISPAHWNRHRRYERPRRARTRCQRDRVCPRAKRHSGHSAKGECGARAAHILNQPGDGGSCRYRAGAAVSDGDAVKGAARDTAPHNAGRTGREGKCRGSGHDGNNRDRPHR